MPGCWRATRGPRHRVWAMRLPQEHAVPDPAPHPPTASWQPSGRSGAGCAAASQAGVSGSEVQRSGATYASQNAMSRSSLACTCQHGRKQGGPHGVMMTAQSAWACAVVTPGTGHSSQQPGWGHSCAATKAWNPKLPGVRATHQASHAGAECHGHGDADGAGRLRRRPPGSLLDLRQQRPQLLQRPAAPEGVRGVPCHETPGPCRIRRTPPRATHGLQSKLQHGGPTSST